MSMPSGGWVNEVVGDFVPLDVLVDFRLMIAVIAERIKYLGQGQVRQAVWDFLGCHAQPPELDNRPDRGSRTADDRFARQNCRVPYDVAMFGDCLHTGNYSGILQVWRPPTGSGST